MCMGWNGYVGYPSLTCACWLVFHDTWGLLEDIEALGAGASRGEGAVQAESLWPKQVKTMFCYF